VPATLLLAILLLLIALALLALAAFLLLLLLPRFLLPRLALLLLARLLLALLSALILLITHGTLLRLGSNARKTRGSVASFLCTVGVCLHSGYDCGASACA